jgi:hypothetical protein
MLALILIVRAPELSICAGLSWLLGAGDAAQIETAIAPLVAAWVGMDFRLDA